MTNEEYQKSRGLDQPFNSTPEQVEAEWVRLQKDWMKDPTVSRKAMMRAALARARRRVHERAQE